MKKDYKTLKMCFPGVEWMGQYRKEDLRWDLIAALSVAIMLVPQAMAYAMLAGLPPVMGLYAATLPVVGYALLGSSRQLAVGPVAIVSIMVAAACSEFAPPGTEKYLYLAQWLAIMVGVIQLGLGFLRAGFIANFFSHAVISGFTSAAAIIICVSQLKYLLGIELETHKSIFVTLYSIMVKLGDVNWVTLLLGLISHGVLILVKKKWPKIPGSLLVVVGGCLLAYLFKLESYGVKIVGDVPSGLPGVSIPSIGFVDLWVLLPSAIAITFVGFTESIAIAEFVAEKKKYRINPNQEFRGLGAANVIAGVFSGYPVMGGFSRTAVNYDMGARTGLSGLCSGAFVLIVLLVLTPLFYHLPKVVLASIIVMAVVGLVDWKEAIRLMKLKKADGMTLVATFVLTLTLGIEQGIIIGVVLSLLLYIWRTAHPHIVELGHLQEEDIYRSVERFAKAKMVPGILIVRVDASMYFANMGLIEKFIEECVQKRGKIRWVVFDLSGVNDVDAVAISRLEDLMQSYRSIGIQFSFAAMKGPVRDLVKKAGWLEKYGRAIDCPSVKFAIKGIPDCNE